MPPLYRVSILDHPCVDYLVSFCGNGAIWCLERVGIVQYYERVRPQLRDATIHGRVTGRGFFLPVAHAGSLGKRYEMYGLTLAHLWNTAEHSRGKAGRETEKAFAWHVANRYLEPTFTRVIRKATEQEDRELGVDFFCVSDVADRSGVQVKWDSKAELSGNLWIQIETEPVTDSWTQAPSERVEEWVP